MTSFLLVVLLWPQIMFYNFLALIIYSLKTDHPFMLVVLPIHTLCRENTDNITRP